MAIYFNEMSSALIRREQYHVRAEPDKVAVLELAAHVNNGGYVKLDLMHVTLSEPIKSPLETELVAYVGNSKISVSRKNCSYKARGIFVPCGVSVQERSLHF
jgi:hypothetical protein